MRPHRIPGLRTCLWRCSPVALGLVTNVAVALVIAGRHVTPWFGSDTCRFFERYGRAWSCFEMSYGGRVTLQWGALEPYEPGEAARDTIAKAWRASEHGVRGAPPYGMSARPPCGGRSPPRHRRPARAGSTTGWAGRWCASGTGSC